MFPRPHLRPTLAFILLTLSGLQAGASGLISTKAGASNAAWLLAQNTSLKKGRFVLTTTGVANDPNGLKVDTTTYAKILQGSTTNLVPDGLVKEDNTVEFLLASSTDKKRAVLLKVNLVDGNKAYQIGYKAKIKSIVPLCVIPDVQSPTTNDQFAPTNWSAVFSMTDLDQGDLVITATDLKALNSGR